MRRRLLCLGPLALLLLTPAVFGATYYASPNGNDDNPGTRQRPWATLDKANGAIQPGDTVILASGRYDGVIEPTHSGRAGQPLVTALQSDSGREVRVNDTRPFYDGFGIPGERGDLVFIGPPCRATCVPAGGTSTGSQSSGSLTEFPKAFQSEYGSTRFGARSSGAVRFVSAKARLTTQAPTQTLSNSLLWTTTIATRLSSTPALSATCFLT